jgi:flagellar biosynthesis GTPase FlhF
MEQVINKTKNFEEKIRAFEECVLSNEYYVTYIDIYLLSKYYDLPIILLCNTIIDLTITKEKYIVFNLSRNNKYFFIKNRSVYDRNKFHNYKLIINASSVDFNIDKDLLDTSDYKLASKIKDSVNNYEDILGNYINDYSVNKKKLIAKLNAKQKKQNKLEKEEQKKLEEEQVKQAQQQKKLEEEQKKLEERQEEVKQEQEKLEERQEEVEQEEVKQEQEQEQELKKNKQTKNSKPKRTRCPNGTRKNKETGLCEKIL